MPSSGGWNCYCSVLHFEKSVFQIPTRNRYGDSIITRDCLIRNAIIMGDNRKINIFGSLVAKKKKIIIIGHDKSTVGEPSSRRRSFHHQMGINGHLSLTLTATSPGGGGGGAPPHTRWSADGRKQDRNTTGPEHAD